MLSAIFSKQGFTTLVVLLVALLVIWAIVGKPLTEGALRELEKMGLTNHAANTHKGQAYTAEEIRQKMVTRQCTAYEYICADNDTEIYYCISEKNPFKALGLVIGRTVRIIVTGFGGPTGYWEDRCP